MVMLAILSAPISRPRFALLIDRRRSQPVTTAFVLEMRAFFQLHREALADSVAAIVADDDAGFGMARMTALRNPDATIEAFRSYDDAVAWLTSELTR